MKVSVFFRLTRFFLKTLRYPGRVGTGGITVEADYPGKTGPAFDLYHPAKRKGTPVMVLHGITLKGNRDPRLVNFCRSLAALGIPAVAPAMPLLARGLFSPDDVSLIEDVAKRCQDLFGGMIGIIGFSFGAGYGLLAAGNPEMHAVIKYVISFGSYYSLDRLFGQWLTWKDSDPVSEHDLDNRIYTSLVIASNQEKILPLGKAARDGLRSLLMRYCDEATLEEKEAFFNEHIADAGPALLQGYFSGLDKALLEKMSLAGRMARCRSAINLIHDINDPVVPYGQSELIFEELRKNRPMGDQSLLCTSIISHVKPGRIRIGDTVRLYRAMAPIFS